MKHKENVIMPQVTLIVLSCKNVFSTQFFFDRGFEFCSESILHILPYSAITIN